MSDFQIKFAQAGQLKERQFIVIEETICRIDTIDKSKPGKHGAAKIRITATGVFNDKRMNLLKPADADVEVPVIDKGNAQVISDSGDKYQIMDVADYQTYDVDTFYKDCKKESRHRINIFCAFFLKKEKTFNLKKRFIL
jgi:translation initiation factor 5A